MRNHNRFTTVILKTIAVLLVVGEVPAISAQDGPVVVTDAGNVRGVMSQADPAVNVFRGIPYAAPPVAMNRWRKPQPVSAWSGIRNADTFGPRCVQLSTDPDPYQYYSSEDCLYLNVWMPVGQSASGLPVMVWVHDGRFMEGSGSDPLYDGTHLAGKGAVVVTFNYRLNSLGFLAHPDLSSEAPGQVSGNYALADALAALNWVKNNIDGFGGDPDNITVLGNGAGAELTAGLIGSPESKGLFQRAVLQNAGYMGAKISRTKSLEQTEGNGERISEIFNKHSLEKLRALNTREAYFFYPAGGTIVVDGQIIPQDLSDIYTNDRQNRVDVLVGYSPYTAENTAAFPPSAEQFSLMTQRFGDLQDAFLELFPAANDGQAAESYEASSEQEQAWHLRSIAALQKKAGNQAWVYQFSRTSDIPQQGHDPQLQFATGNLAPGNSANASNRAMSDTLTDYLLNFARTGNPNNPGLPAWPAFEENEPGNVLVFDQDIQPDKEVYPSPDVLSFFDTAYEAFLNK